MLKRYRTSLLWITIAAIIAFNSVAIPLFLYGAFGQDSNIGLEGISWFLNVLLVLWIFLIAPNIPFFGIIVSILQGDEHELHHHLWSFAGVMLGALCFFLGNKEIYIIFALLFTQIFGITSLAFLIHKKWIRDHSSYPK